MTSGSAGCPGAYRRRAGGLRAAGRIVSVVLLGTCCVFAAGDESETLGERVERLERELERLRSDDTVERGARLFAGACAACHGSDGRGDGPGAADLDPAPRDLSTLQIRFRTTPSGEPPRPEDLKRTIREGLPGTSMPAFGRLFSEREITALTRFIESLRGGEGAVGPVAVPELAPSTRERLREGRAVYLAVGCWRCHGVEGGGNGPSAPFLTDENDRPIRVPDFRYHPFKGGRDAVALARALITGLNGSPMPAYGEVLLIVRDEPVDLPPEEQLDPDDHDALALLQQKSPTRARLEAMAESERAEQREARLTALVHYVLSLDRRRGAGYWLLRERPEREARRP